MSARPFATAEPFLDLGAIRARFPALARRQGPDSVAYFDGPGGTQVPREVVESMTEYLYHHNANTHWQFATSRETDRALEQARGALADFLNAAPHEIVFGANMTTLTFHLARALGRRWGKGDEVVVTELDHHANVAPWRALEEERGITVRVIPLDAERLRIDWTALEQVLNPRTRLVAIGAASNAIGTVNEVGRAAALAHQAGALCFVDAVHFAPHHLVDVQTMGCDFLACSAYKFYGPHVGVLFGRRDLLQALDAPKLEPAPDTGPERLELGTQNHEGIVGAAAAVDFMAGLAEPEGGGRRRARLEEAFRRIHHRAQALFERLWTPLASCAGVRVYGVPPAEPRTPTIAFAIPGKSADQVAERLAGRGLFVSSGDFYATTLVARLGHAADGVVRAGLACYSTEEEVDRLVEAVLELAGS
jgi:cysteine desulfurase family protein (TIGR01976 family)